MSSPSMAGTSSLGTNASVETDSMASTPAIPIFIFLFMVSSRTPGCSRNSANRRKENTVRRSPCRLNGTSSSPVPISMVIATGRR